jgi:signal transduction histidine kinase
MPAPIAQVHRAGLERYMRTGHGLIVDADGPVEMPAVTRSGEEIRVELTLSELASSDGERFAVAMIRDAMQRKTLELTNLELVQARVARSEAEAELAARDELLDTVIDTLQTADVSGVLRDLTDALHEFRRLHTGQLAVRLAQADLVDIVHAAADAARRRSPGRRLLIDTPPNAPVTCDPARIRQVLDQLLDEAIRRTSGGARISMRLEMVSPHLAQLTIRSDACGDTRPAGASLQLSRTLVQRQGGTFATAISSGGSLEVVMTIPGSPHTARRKPSRSRKLGRRAAS